MPAYENCMFSFVFTADMVGYLMPTKLDEQYILLVYLALQV